MGRRRDHRTLEAVSGVWTSSPGGRTVLGSGHGSGWAAVACVPCLLALRIAGGGGRRSGAAAHCVELAVPAAACCVEARREFLRRGTTDSHVRAMVPAAAHRATQRKNSNRSEADVRAKAGPLLAGLPRVRPAQRSANSEQPRRRRKLKRRGCRGPRNLASLACYLVSVLLTVVCRGIRTVRATGHVLSRAPRGLAPRSA